MMFSTGLLLSAGATVVLAVTDSLLESTGHQWVGTILRIAIPLSCLAFGVYFIETNDLLRWLR